MRFDFTTRGEAKKREADERFRRSMMELAEQSCLNRLNAGMNCRETCADYGTKACRHSEKAFPC